MKRSKPRTFAEVVAAEHPTGRALMDKVEEFETQQLAIRSNVKFQSMKTSMGPQRGVSNISTATAAVTSRPSRAPKPRSERATIRCAQKPDG
jgi:hypothetical protein